MTDEPAFIAALRALATDPAARGLLDDAAVLAIGGENLVLTHDTIAEGVHFLAADPAEDVAWKLLAVNLSDLAAKGAEPIGLLIGYTLSDDEAWDSAFLRGLEQAIRTFSAPLLGGDTVSVRPGAPRTLGLTAIGRAATVPARSGAKAGDLLWTTGTIGDAGAGLRIALGEIDGPLALIDRYRRPQPRLAAGQRLAALVSAMMDISDGLLIDTTRMAEASGLAVSIDLAAVPLSIHYVAACGDDLRARTDAAIAGDDYELLFAAAPERSANVRAIGEALGLAITRIGSFSDGTGIAITQNGAPVPLPPSLGWQHGSAPPQAIDVPATPT